MAKRTSSLAGLEFPTIVGGSAPQPKGKALIKMESVDLEPKGEPTLIKSILKALDGPPNSIERLAFESDPRVNNNYASIYKAKKTLIPDSMLKRIAIQDDLVAAIVNARGKQVAAFGRPRPDRFSTGFVVEPKAGVVEKLTREQKDELDKRLHNAVTILNNCGHTKNLKRKDRCSFSQWLEMSTKNAVTVGRLATEIIWGMDSSGERVFHSFRTIDAGTILQAASRQDSADSVREEGIRMLERLKNKRLKEQRPTSEDTEFAWVQVHDGNPIQAFTDEECVVENFYPVNDIELDGYPVTPIDTMMSAVVTHINITTHNKIYFQTGRATRGMLVIKSDDADENVVGRVKQQFNASINSVNNAWRMPVFAVGSQDEISWQPIDNSSRDMEFQYLTDMNARVIMSAFQISPDELPGWSHLSRGTNNQGLCLALGSKITVEGEGLKSLEQVLDGALERRLRVWTGTKFEDAKVFLTGQRRETLTTLGNGTVVKTSPDHRFRVVGPDGSPAWCHQKNLEIGDTVLVSKKPVPGSVIPEYEGRALTPAVMEVLGWLTGDGNISVRFNKNTGNIKQGVLSWFYHHEKERDLWARHAEVLSAWGLPVRRQEREVGEDEAEDIKQRYGFKSVAKTRIKNIVYDTAFVQWLLALGFQSSADGKVVPAVVHAMPESFRAAFLRGLWSADGSLVHKKTGSKAGAKIVIHDDKLRGQVRELLGGLGIRTQLQECVHKQHIDGVDRRMVPGATTLTIRDKVLFYERVGFLQAHKQPAPEDLQNCRDSDVVPGALARALTADLGSVRNVPRTWNDGCTLGFLRGVLQAEGREVPAWVEEHHFETVVSLEDTEQNVLMADVEVFDDSHAFVVNASAIVHNSESNNEFKLEAARDLGIRPLLARFEDFLNSAIFPLIDPALARIAHIRLIGLDAETAEKESVRLQQDMPVHMTYDQVLEKVEKLPVGKEWGGEFPLNPQWQSILDKYVPVGRIVEHFFGIAGASQDPNLQYVRDPFWFNKQNLLMQAQQAQVQAQQPPPGGDDGGGDSSNEEKDPGEGVSDDKHPGGDDQDQAQQAQPANQQPGGDLTRSIDQAISALKKGEDALPPSKRRILQRHRLTMKQAMDTWEEDLRRATADIVAVAEKHTKKRN